jgi:hypothetical protein
MATNDDEYRTKLIRAVEKVQAQRAEQEFNSMSDDELMDFIVQGWAPAGTRLTTEQMEMILEHCKAGEGSEPV